MIRRVYERCSGVFEQVWVATDDLRIYNEVEGFGGRVVMTSGSHESGTERCYEALVKIEEKLRCSFDIIVNIQGDEPCISQVQLKELTGCFEDGKTEIATLVSRFGELENIFDPGTPKVTISKNLFALYFSRSVIPYVRGYNQEQWSCSAVYYKHIGLYGYTRQALSEIVRLKPTPAEKAEKLEQGYSIKVAITEQPSFSIDTPEDLEMLLSGDIIDE